LAIYFLNRLRGVTVQTVVLLGIALVFLFTSLLSLLQYIASEEALQQVVFWTLGSLAKAAWPKIGTAAVVLAITIPFFVRQAWVLTASRLGDATAQSLGIDIEKLRLRSLISISVLAAVAVAFVGTIGFRRTGRPSCSQNAGRGGPEVFLAYCGGVAGALLLSVTSIVSSVTSIVSKSIIPGVLFPIGTITSLIGIPFFLSLILTKTRQLW
jgi:iron complex transport system permease protein